MDAPLPIDPQITRLRIGSWGIVPSDLDGWRALGECIGSHKHLRELTFWGVDTTLENLEALLTGVSRNRTVGKFHIIECHGEWPLGILAMFFQNNQKLYSIKVYRCREGFITSLSVALRGCTSRSLQHIDYSSGFRVDDDDNEEFIEALAEIPQLKELELMQCNIGLRGCGAVAALLQRPACVLQKVCIEYSRIVDEGLTVLEPAVASSRTLTELSLAGMGLSTAALHSFAGILRNRACVLKNLDLGGNSIGDDAIILFADALTTNRRLKELYLDNNNNISDIGFAAMTRALCNTSSIGDVYSSNHTLQNLGSMEMPWDLHNYLCMNENKNKSLVAHKKILMHFFQGNFSMVPFHGNNMIPNALPHLLRWIGRTSDQESFTAVFNFLRRMPSLWGNRRSVLRRSRRKRKVLN